MKKKLASILITTMALLILCMTTVFAAEGETSWENSAMTVTGYGSVPPTAVNPGQARAMARRAAIVDAYRYLAEMIQGVNVDATTTVENYITQSDLVKTKVNALIKGARILSEKMNEDGSYEVVMQISMYGASNSLASSVLPTNPKIEAFPSPSSVNVSVSVNNPTPSATNGSSAAAVPNSAKNIHPTGSYTGLIVDCSGMDLRPVMSPVIRNANNEPIYGYKNLNSQTVISRGMAGYTRDINVATRAGSNPLVVKAIRVDDYNSYPVLSVEDANRVLVENQTTKFLDNCSVVFVR